MRFVVELFGSAANGRKTIARGRGARGPSGARQAAPPDGPVSPLRGSGTHTICTYQSEPAYSAFAEERDFGGFRAKVYSPAKTVADCFKFRGKVGLDVAIEALHDGWRHRKFTTDGLMAAARIDGVENVIRPYAMGMLVP